MLQIQEHDRSKGSPDAQGAIPVTREKGLIDRLQVIDVTSNTGVLPDVFDPAVMAREAMDFASTLPAFFKTLFEGQDKVDGVENKFKGILPDFVIYDVSDDPSSRRLMGL